MKLSEIVKLPVTANQESFMGVAVFVVRDSRAIEWAEFDSLEKASTFADILNTYDALVEENAKLKALPKE